MATVGAVMRTMAQADVCAGRKIWKAYRAYQGLAEPPVEMKEFCRIIHQADIDESLCPNGQLLPPRELATFVDVND